MKTAIAIASILLTGGFVFAQTGRTQTPAARSAAQTAKGTGQHQGMMMQGGMADQCKAMMAKREQMMADMKKMDAELDQKLQAMQTAQGQAKVDAMAAVITEMVRQRRERQGRMMAMQQSMMAHMSDHMAQGGMQMNCPMMSQMGGSRQPGAPKP